MESVCSSARKSNFRFTAKVVLIALVITMGLVGPSMAARQAVARVNVPYFPVAVNPAQGAILWFGQVSNSQNYADVRLAYDDDKLLIVLHIFDRRLWYDLAPSPASDLSAWDAASVYLHVSSVESVTLTEDSYRFVAQLSHWQARDNYQQTYRASQSAWTQAQIPIVTTAGWRGSGLNDDTDDRGWTARFEIPFDTLGMAGPPPTGTLWRLGLALHDRDDQQGTVLPDQFWPHSLDSLNPASWGHLRFGMPTYTPPLVQPSTTIVVRHGLDGVKVADGHVGGHSICGNPFGPTYFEDWGSANYAGFAQVNIQNQWDVADWPCFSKYYATFPLDMIPQGSAVLSATLTMYLFGNAGYAPGDAKPSHIQLATVAEDWDEATLTWNNAPLLKENHAYAWVEPVDFYAEWPGVAVTWDVAHTLADATASGEPLRIVLYSTDGDYHSGKYFWSSDAGEAGRPKLQVTFGDPINPGFALQVAPAIAEIQAGGVATYTLSVHHDASFQDDVTITSGPSPADDLTLNFGPPVTLAPPGGQTSFVVRHDPDIRQANLIAHTIPITASGGGVTHTTSVVLRINGSTPNSSTIYLPLLGER